MFEPEPSMFGLPAGVIFLLLGVISMAFGYVLIRRIVDIKV
jgi:drug/metabolite transporter (DMT)-like permease